MSISPPLGPGGLIHVNSCIIQTAHTVGSPCHVRKKKHSPICSECRYWRPTICFYLCHASRSTYKPSLQNYARMRINSILSQLTCNNFQAQNNRFTKLFTSTQTHRNQIRDLEETDGGLTGALLSVYDISCFCFLFSLICCL